MSTPRRHAGVEESLADLEARLEQRTRLLQRQILRCQLLERQPNAMSVQDPQTRHTTRLAELPRLETNTGLANRHAERRRNGLFAQSELTPDEEQSLAGDTVLMVANTRLAQRHMVQRLGRLSSPTPSPLLSLDEIHQHVQRISTYVQTVPEPECAASTDEAENQCGICQEELVQSGEGAPRVIKFNQCKHAFHEGCLVEWFHWRQREGPPTGGDVLRAKCPRCRCELFPRGNNAPRHTQAEYDAEYPQIPSAFARQNRRSDPTEPYTGTDQERVHMEEHQRVIADLNRLPSAPREGFFSSSAGGFTRRARRSDPIEPYTGHSWAATLSQMRQAGFAHGVRIPEPSGAYTGTDRTNSRTEAEERLLAEITGISSITRGRISSSPAAGFRHPSGSAARLPDNDRGTNRRGWDPYNLGAEEEERLLEQFGPTSFVAIAPRSQYLEPATRSSENGRVPYGRISDEGYDSETPPYSTSHSD
ncbi:hypothetical protein BU23DRAFT_567722 [Bimuria novae-zelandiae CBS 107.79]|uniref:RING-type domain-containing protein n=1 Tax=Bimuria novae-zelandiae CBS 107.79 TaxID=1447943 RepID=A0A6A5VBM6_9PLEO|nr:hypothetical protein BU23DRAFT_567722 [Bimuria novae-zelandiae CBS 107.79]